VSGMFVARVLCCRAGMGVFGIGVAVLWSSGDWEVVECKKGER
jgi:hypothetical protein